MIYEGGKCKHTMHSGQKHCLFPCRQTVLQGYIDMSLLCVWIWWYIYWFVLRFSDTTRHYLIDKNSELMKKMAAATLPHRHGWVGLRCQERARDDGKEAGTDGQSHRVVEWEKRWRGESPTQQQANWQACAKLTVELQTQDFHTAQGPLNSH